MRKSWIWIGWLAAGLLLAPFVVPFLPVFGWVLVGINCEQQDINIKTGQGRYSRSLWFVRVSERIKDTPLSLALQGETVNIADVQAWHRVNTFFLGGGYSPQYAFHGAFSQASQVGMIQSDLKLGRERNCEIARAILTAWQQSGNAHGANACIQNLMKERILNKTDARDR
jgi:hypothetical protein